MFGKKLAFLIGLLTISPLFSFPRIPKGFVGKKVSFRGLLAGVTNRKVQNACAAIGLKPKEIILPELIKRALLKQGPEKSAAIYLLGLSAQNCRVPSKGNNKLFDRATQYFPEKKK